LGCILPPGRGRGRNAPAGVAVRCTTVMLIKGNLSVARERARERERERENWPGVITNTCGCPFRERYVYRGSEVEEVCHVLAKVELANPHPQ